MVQKLGIGACLCAAMLAAALAVSADAASDLMKVQAAFKAAKSWHADEVFQNGRTITVDFVAPDRWRIQPTSNMTELVIGDDVYMVHNGRPMKMPMGGAMVHRMLDQVGVSVNDDIKQTAKDLGMQTVDGRSLHAYSYTAQGTPVTLYVGSDWLPVQSVVSDKRGTMRVKYSKFNAPISIEQP